MSEFSTILATSLASITPLDRAAMEQARQRQQQLTKPAGSLGRLEEIAIRIAGMQQTPVPRINHKAVIVMAGDHGVTREGVSAYPAAVTPQMVLNFLQGGAAINALARQANVQMIIVDVGVAAELSHPGLLSRKVAYGTANMAQGPAMTPEQMMQALLVGIETAHATIAQGADLLAIGEMGIGNTTAASAIAAALLQLPVSELTGYGTGIDEEQRQHKVRVIEQALAVNQPDPLNPLEVLRCVGGLEIAGLVGVLIGAVEHRVPVVIDGFISTAAALVASTLHPTIREYLFAGHASVERGHRLILERLELRPLLQLDMRLGEGTGAVLAMQIVEAAVCTHSEMATFAEAGVSDRPEHA
ncbi:nicotinate-nucleotide-dimethylbenzimidazole phosphoribosyltransferase [Thermosporothrix hazakensis]|uniref:Nicotinate-nucleotide--dimethylbenzimidazole phosphoribosyltransferase n=1 Tax=Thermosporothrix hazakensis TaxID=644383 RepID=A0A326UAH8_THEHA|nr:nicotinate-nucleotide--dimethylbenzimidazole phosphoribosyltransferase [Thermosporothrix hazakensis]PZW29494.1 nicotinate-nucleotide-dimethylbenzimidazole phosphoribosyltransferase [Thermosporothrix hazakensis]GCE45791.1 nicotinate-nucleotide--dimethylbenzimidazole phosphoribosyltransferase [Thermosporothrix hazakensis]